MARIPIIYNGLVKITQLPKQDVGKLLSDCLQELIYLCEGNFVGCETYELIDAVNEYFALIEKESGG